MRSRKPCSRQSDRQHAWALIIQLKFQVPTAPSLLQSHSQTLTPEHKASQFNQLNTNLGFHNCIFHTHNAPNTHWKLKKKRKEDPPPPPPQPGVENYSLCDRTVLRVIGAALHQTALPTWLRWDSWQCRVAVAQINTVSIKINHTQLWYSIDRNITAIACYSVNVTIQKLIQNVQAHSENGSDAPRGACGKQVDPSICRTANAHTLRWGTSLVEFMDLVCLLPC